MKERVTNKEWQGRKKQVRKKGKKNERKGERIL
jgi:hypothetical protein